jgi:hypothetical protein
LRARAPSLTPRIALALAAVGLLPLLLAFARLTQLQREGFEDQVLITHSVAARTAAERVGSWLGSLDAAGEALVNNPLVLADARSATSQALVSSTLAAHPELVAIVLTSPTGELVLRAQRREQAAAVEALLAGPPTRPLAAPEAAGRRWIVRSLALPEARGALRLVADATPLEDALRAFEIGSEDAELVLVDGEGAVLAGDALRLTDFPAAQVEAAQSGKLSGAARYPVADGGPAVLGAFAPVGADGWFVLTRQPARLAERIANRLRGDSLRSLGLALVLVAALASLGHYGLVRPLKRLIAAQRELAGLAGPATSGNEIEALREAFAVLERRLRDQEDLGRVFLGRYQVVALIGHGAMGTVFRGWDPKLERPVALKTVRLADDLSESRRQELAAKLLQEAVTVARFVHPHIVGVYDVEAAGDLAFFAMEHIEGIGLEKVLWRRGALPPDQAACIALALARALEGAHQRGVVHRDVKPSNVLLGYDGSIKVTDFGIAELVSSGHKANDVFFGTPGYVPPETLSSGRYDQRGDLFALGVVVYETLTGVCPFAGRNVQQTMTRTLDHEPESVRFLRPEVPAALDALVMRLLAKTTAGRPASASEVAAELARQVAEAGWAWDPSWLPRTDEKGQIETLAHSQIFPTLAGRSTGRIP